MAFQSLVNEANEANERERRMKLSTALKIYPKAIGWSMVLSSCLIVSGPSLSTVLKARADAAMQMEGYQNAVVGSCEYWLVFLSFTNPIEAVGNHNESDQMSKLTAFVA